MAQFLNFEGDYLGLNEQEVERSIELYGLNRYSAKDKGKNKFSESTVLCTPSAIMLLIAGIISLFTKGGIGTGIAVLLIDALYCAAEIYLAKRSDKLMNDIRTSSEIRFRVIRNGKMTLVDKEHVLTDDILVVQAGERVPADAFIREARDLTVDEYVLSSSHNAVAKKIGAAKKSALNESFVYSGTTVLSGIAICEVTAVGVDTKFYQKYGELPESHPYHTAMESIIYRSLPICAAVSCVIAVITLIVAMADGVTLIPSVLRGITLALCFFPTGLATIVRLYYTRCASEMLRNMAVVKSLNDIEKLNSMSVLCVEKSGVISKDTVEVRNIYTDSEELLYNVAVLSIDRSNADTAEKALLLKATFYDENIYEVTDKNTCLEKLPNGDDSLDGALWDLQGTKLYCIKGNPEKVFPMCHMKSDELFAAKKKLSEYYEQGCRVLALACADATENASDSTVGFRYTFIGLVAFSAPLRDNVTNAIRTCKKSNVRVVMFSNDNDSVAAATAKMIGLSGATPVTGKDVASAMRSGASLNLRSDVYCQLTEEQKLYVMKELKRSGEAVGMAATRADDAMLLEQADIGLTMSQYTTGSAYESSNIIINDDKFSSIANTIASARQVHRNIKKAFSALISGYISLFVINLANLFSGSQLMLSPALIALLTMVLLPAAAFMYFGSKGNYNELMPPSAFVANRKLNLRFVLESVLIGAVSGIIAVASYSFMYSDANTEFARSSALIALTFCLATFGIIHINRKNPFMHVIKSLAALISLAVLIVIPIALVYIPAVNTAFGLMAIDLLALFISIASGVVPAIIYYVVRRLIKNK